MPNLTFLIIQLLKLNLSTNEVKNYMRKSDREKRTGAELKCEEDKILNKICICMNAVLIKYSKHKLKGTNDSDSYCRIINRDIEKMKCIKCSSVILMRAIHI